MIGEAQHETQKALTEYLCFDNTSQPPYMYMIGEAQHETQKALTEYLCFDNTSQPPYMYMKGEAQHETHNIFSLTILPSQHKLSGHHCHLHGDSLEGRWLSAFQGEVGVSFYMCWFIEVFSYCVPVYLIWIEFKQAIYVELPSFSL